MRKFLIHIFAAFAVFSSCTSGNSNLNIISYQDEDRINTFAVFKNATQVTKDQWRLIFRKLDDCRYISLNTDTAGISSLVFPQILSLNNAREINSDFIDLRFSISYTVEEKKDPVTGNTISENILKEISRVKSGRFISAGIDNDIQIDDFLLRLKTNIKRDSANDISSMVLYPFSIFVQKKKIIISEPDEFVAYYNAIFNRKIKLSILNQSPADIKTGPDGLVIGNNDLVINIVNNRVLITSISTY